MLDPITAAFLAGTVGRLSSKSIEEAYEFAKEKIKSSFGERHPIVNAIKELELKPESIGRKELLIEEFNEGEIMNFPDVVSAIKTLQVEVNKHNLHYAPNNMNASGSYISQAAGNSTAVVNERKD